jgi:hypothetical protein
MTLYFLKEETPGTSPKIPETKPRSMRHWGLFASIVAILVSALIQGAGFFLPMESLLPGMLGIQPPPKSRTVLLAVDTSTDGTINPMDEALVLRGLAILHPSLIIMAAETEASGGDSQRLIDIGKARLREQGISLIEGTSPAAHILWRPVSLCRYTPPIRSGSGKSLPLLEGMAPPEGTCRWLPSPPSSSPGKLPLLARTAAGGIVASIWWEGLLHGRSTTPVSLLDDRLLILPNNALLLMEGGRTSPGCVSDAVETYSTDDFLLRMEERERGTSQADFDAVWERSVVVVGPPSLEGNVAAMSALRKMTSWGGISLTWQFLITAALIACVWVLHVLPRKTALLMTLALLLGGIGTGWWCIRRGILPQLLPWLAGVTVALGATRMKRR